EGPWTPVYKEYGYEPEKIRTNFNDSLKEILQNHSNEDIRNIIAKNDELRLAENYDQYFGRINTFSKMLLNKKHKNVLIVCHGGTSQLLLEILLQDGKNITEPENCSTSIVKIKNNQIKLVQFDDVSYL